MFGIYFTAKSGFYRPRALLSTLKDTLLSLTKKKNGGISSFSAVATALGGTVGVGSIVGVGYGITVGGAGSIFWMWVCSFFGMGLKYAEVKIALTDRVRVGNNFLGGAPFRLRSLGNRRLAVVFCLFCVLASFGTGNLTQVGSISGFLGEVGVPRAASGLLCAGLISLAVFGGRERIAGVNTVIVPLASGIYIIVCVAMLYIFRDGIVGAFSLIFREAFGLTSVVGGVSGAVISRALREGFVRSMFSNEAGMGSSPLAHATAEVSDPTVQAKWGIFEIFFDSFVVSTLTALCLLSGGFGSADELFRVSLGSVGFWGFGALIAVFAFASVLSWCYYSECCIDFLFPNGKRALTVYRVMFVLASFLGVFLSGDTVWEISDILNVFMMFPNLVLLFKCRNEIERI